MHTCVQNKKLPIPPSPVPPQYMSAVSSSCILLLHFSKTSSTIKDCDSAVFSKRTLVELVGAVCEDGTAGEFG